MSVSSLRKLLDDRKVPHRDCLEKGELLFRAKQALSAEAAEMTEAERLAVSAEQQYKNVKGSGVEERKDIERKEDWDNEEENAREGAGVQNNSFDDPLYGSSRFDSFATGAINPKRDDTGNANDAGNTFSNPGEEEDDGLVFRLSRRSGKRSSPPASSSLSSDVAPDQKVQISAAEVRKKKQERLRAKRRAVSSKQRSGRRPNRRENRRQKKSPESTLPPSPPTSSDTAGVAPRPAAADPRPAQATTAFVLPTPLG